MAQQIVDLASMWQLLVTFITGTIPDGRQASMDEGRLSMEATCMPSGPETDANTLPAWDQYFTEKKDVQITSRETTFRCSLASSCMQPAATLYTSTTVTSNASGACFGQLQLHAPYPQE